jgi:4-diphosphocytidyl-2C-methyl-D-erythritol kinase
VTNVGIYDTIILRKRKDDLITLKEKGILARCAKDDNNAVKSAKLFMQTFSTTGVDIILKKNIPVGAGLGGSSADIAGVMIGMKKLFGVSVDVKPLCDQLGSDSGYMSKGGLKVIKGRGEKIQDVFGECKYYALVITENKTVLAKDCYETFDKLHLQEPSTTDDAVCAIENKDEKAFFSAIKNHLYPASKKILPVIEKNLLKISKYADASLMTGSGSAVVGLFKKKKDRDFAFKSLYAEYKDRLIKTKTI